MLTHQTIPYRSVYPDDFDEDPFTEMVLKMLGFLNSEYVPPERKQLSRSARREVERAWPRDRGRLRELHRPARSGTRPARRLSI
jgi:hypothetical protein